MPKLRSTYDGHLIFKTSHEGRKAVLVGTIRLQSREISHEKFANTKQEITRRLVTTPEQNWNPIYKLPYDNLTTILR